MTREELELYYAIYLTPGIGAKRLVSLCEYFGNADKAFTATKAQVQAIDGFGKVLAADFTQHRSEALETSRKQLSKLSEEVKIITYFDEAFPDHLRKIFQPPALLFVTGNSELLNAQKNLAIIGTRKMTDYGKRATLELCKEFAKHDVVITSGFASGVDTCAHEAIFEAGGSTIAVLGSGIDVLYPSSNKGLAKKL